MKVDGVFRGELIIKRDKNKNAEAEAEAELNARQRVAGLLNRKYKDKDRENFTHEMREVDFVAYERIWHPE